MKMLCVLLVLCVTGHLVSGRYVGSIEEIREKNKDLLKLAGVGDLDSFPKQVSRIIDLSDVETGPRLGPLRRFLCEVVADNSASFDTSGYRAADDDIAPQVDKCEYDSGTKTYTVDFTYTDINQRNNKCTGTEKELFVNQGFTTTFSKTDPTCALVEP